MTTKEQVQLNNAILYALRCGCLFPVTLPKPGASIDKWIRWGAMRHLHSAIAEAFRETQLVEDGVRRRWELVKGATE